MQIIGLGHYSRTGKDTLAQMVGARVPLGRRVVVRSFAWKVKDICHQLYAWAGVREPEFYESGEGESAREVKLPALNVTPVELWVAMGTPAIRENVYNGTWVDFLLNEYKSADVLIIPDVRFPNEVDAIRSRGGWLVKVVREGYGPRDTVADRKLCGFDGWDYVAGPTLEALRHDADYLADCIRARTKPTQSEAMRAAILARENLTAAKAA